MNYFLAALKKYAVFSGRARRAEYWYFVLFYSIITILVAIVYSALVAAVDSEALAGILGLIFFVYILAMVIPSLSVGVRRLHDTNHSGWWLLISFVPFIGGIWLLVLYAMDSTPGDNKYGQNPKGMMAAQSTQV